MSDVMERLFVVSPHLDDAVFSCGAWLASKSGAFVCTVFAGIPRDAVQTDWDTQCGFQHAHQAMPARHHEDDAALDVLRATPVRLGFLDSQYLPPGESERSDDIAAALAGAIADAWPTALVVPLGLFHSDHHLVHEACRTVWLADTSMPCIAYEDCLYRRMDGLVQQRIAQLHERNFVATPKDRHAKKQDTERKRLAVSRYESQLRAFGPNGYDDAFAPERAWTLTHAR